MPEAGPPNWLEPGEPALANHTMTMMPPTIGINASSCHQPDRPVSCRRRVAAAIVGRIMARLHRLPMTSRLAIERAALTRADAKMNHQKSGRASRPLKLA